MLKKIIVASAMLALIACSSNDDNPKPPNSSPSQGGGDNTSSGSGNPGGPSIAQIVIASNGDQVSELFKNFYYTFSLKESSPENLTQFWNIADTENCKVEKQDGKPPASCQLDLTGAILQHPLTNQYSPLHYNRLTTRIYIDGAASMWKGITLKQWNLTGSGDEAALGLNVSENETDDITDAGITALNKVVSFEYKYAGGAHEFRVGSKADADFWYYEVKNAAPIDVSAPQSITYTTVTIPISELRGMGSFATNDIPFDIKKAAKFLWAVSYNKPISGNNKNSLVLYDFKANIEQ